MGSIVCISVGRWTIWRCDDDRSGLGRVQSSLLEPCRRFADDVSLWAEMPYQSWLRE
jgi:hypothetical protein